MNNMNYVNIVGKIIAQHENILILELYNSVFVAVDVIKLYRRRQLMERQIKINMVIDVKGKLTNNANVGAASITVLIDENGDTPDIENPIKYGRGHV